METLDRKAAGISHKVIRGDVVAFDAADNPIMLIEVKARHEEKTFDKEQLQQYLEQAMDIPYAMLVTLTDIQIYEWKSQTLSLLLKEPTADVLFVYDADFRKKNIYDYYLATLVEVWLRDVEFHWNSETPPLFEQLGQLGLAEKLNGGTTRRMQKL